MRSPDSSSRQVSRRRVLFAPVLLTWLGCSTSAVPHQDSERADEPFLVAQTERFSFSSNPWVNLHHFVYQWARSEAPRAPDDRRRAMVLAEKRELEALSEEDQRAWDSAVAHYRDQVVHRYLAFNGRLIRLKGTLAGTGGFQYGAQVPEFEDITEQLERIMPIYRRTWWVVHDRQNRDRIGELIPKLSSVESEMGERVARAFSGAWPAERLPVDVVRYASWAGAYTTNRPSHITVSQDGLEPSSWRGVESVMHEAAHTPDGPGTSRERAAIEHRAARLHEVRSPAALAQASRPAPEAAGGRDLDRQGQAPVRSAGPTCDSERIGQEGRTAQDEQLDTRPGRAAFVDETGFAPTFGRCDSHARRSTPHPVSGS